MTKIVTGPLMVTDLAWIFNGKGPSALDRRCQVSHDDVVASDVTLSRPLRQIVWANVVTPYNALLLTLTLLVATTHRWGDTLVGLFVVLNSGIGIAQEVRARHILNQLSVVYAPTVRVVRGSTEVVIGVTNLVPGDVMHLSSGDQVPADGFATSLGLEVDESLLSGESEPIIKELGDGLLSGSIAVAGSGTVKVTKVGKDAYAHQVTADVRRLRRTRSTLVEDTNRLLIIVMGSLVVVGPLLLWGELRRNASWQDAVVDAAAAMGAMVPDGLVLLTNMAFLLAAARLAHRGVLTHQLAAVEVLARADTILLDKTGTLTDGSIKLIGVERITDAYLDLDDELIDDVLGALAAEPGSSPTLSAIHQAKKAPIGWNVSASVDFSSSRRWSAVTFDQHGTWAIGAPEVLGYGRHHARVDELAAEGMRVLVLARSDRHPSTPADLEPVALVVLEEQIRPGAPEAIAYMVRQGMTIKVVSGDHPATVAAVARRVGVPHADQGVRFSDMKLSGDIRGSVLVNRVAGIAVFGRVAPDEKRLIVRSLQAEGHVVAMTGDGVNDALALKDADLGIAMASGAPATRALADIVLLDSDFTSLPRLVEEGRRVLANVERVAHLFLVKVLYAALLALLVGVTARAYPFLPRQLTWTAALTIGIPGLVLAGEHTNRRFRPGYLARVLRRSIPAALIATAGLWLCFEVQSGKQGGVARGRAAVSVAAVVMGLGVIELSGTAGARLRLLEASMVALLGATLSWPWSRHQLALELPAEGLTTAVLVGCAVVGMQAWVWRMQAERPDVDHGHQRSASIGTSASDHVHRWARRLGS